MKVKRMIFKKKKEDLLGAILLLATILSAFVANKLLPQKTDLLTKSFAMTTLMILIVWLGIEVNEFRLIAGKRKQYLFIICYLLSLCLVILSGKFNIYNLWMIGGVLIAAYLNTYLGLIIQFIFTYLICSLSQYNIEMFLFYFIIGAVMCLLGQYCNKMVTFVYVTIIVVSCHIVLQFVLNNFIFHNSMNVEAFCSIGTTILVLSATYLGFSHRTNKIDWLLEEIDTKSERNKKKVALEKIESEISDGNTNQTSDVYQIILSEDFELLKQLEHKSMILYKHSQKIANVSANAAQNIGCNEMIARAGGLYHEIGKLKGKDYIEEGILLAKEYNFPEEVIAVMKQHNSKYEKPQSKEAAIVMLTESIVSTINYFEYEKKKAIKEGKEFKEQPNHKIIGNIMDLRVTKGMLDESGISILEFNKLKNFYIEYYSV